MQKSGMCAEPPLISPPWCVSSPVAADQELCNASAVFLSRRSPFVGERTPDQLPLIGLLGDSVPHSAADIATLQGRAPPAPRRNRNSPGSETVFADCTAPFSVTRNHLSSKKTEKNRCLSASSGVGLRSGSRIKRNSMNSLNGRWMSIMTSDRRS